MTLYYTDPELSTVALKSRELASEHIVAHDIDALPGTVEADIGASRGFLSTLAGAIASGSMKAALQAGTAAIGKLAANAGVNIGEVSIAAGTAVIGKLADNAGVNIGTVDQLASASSTVATVASSVSTVTLAASMAARVGCVIFNNSTSQLHVKLGSAASASSWSFIMEPGAYWEMPRRYFTGSITGFWSSANGDARVTQT